MKIRTLVTTGFVTSVTDKCIRLSITTPMTFYILGTNQLVFFAYLYVALVFSTFPFSTYIYGARGGAVG